jgi:putative component of membrane protein insertase Oxa1/YidC/SpoIIIJ protein YidD
MPRNGSHYQAHIWEFLASKTCFFYPKNSQYHTQQYLNKKTNKNHQNQAKGTK